MFICNKFVFLHLHKSGGTFVNQLMHHCIPYARQIGYHLPYSVLPKSYARHPVIGTVRNPWAYYVSWFHFQSTIAQPNALFMLLSKGNTLGFEETIINLLSFNGNNKHFQQVKNTLPDAFQNHGMNLTKDCISSFKNSDKGFYSFLYDRIYQDCNEPIIIKMEDLREGLKAVVEKFNLAPREPILKFINKSPVVNASKHLSYQHYYSDALKKQVEQADAKLISEYNYLF